MVREVARTKERRASINDVAHKQRIDSTQVDETNTRERKRYVSG